MMRYSLPEEMRWYEKIGFTPLGDLLRGRLSGSLHDEAIVKHSGLSVEGAAYVLAVLRGTRFRTKERVAVRDELIDQLLEMEAQGRQSEEIAAELGTPASLARSYRRELDKRRSVFWRVVKWSPVAMAGVAAMYVMTGLMMAWLLRVEPSVDYLAQLNAKAASVKAEDRAWDMYVDAALEADPAEYEWMAQVRQQLLNARQGADANWDDLIEQRGHVLAKLKRSIEMIHEAAARPGLGLLIPAGGVYTGDDAEAIENTGGKPRAVDDPWAITESGPLISQDVVMPQHLWMMRTFSNMLQMEMDEALLQKDVMRAMAAARSLVGMAGHVREDERVFSQLFAQSFLGAMLGGIESWLMEQPGAFSDDDLSELRKLFVRVQQMSELQLSGELLVLEDVLQWQYMRGGWVASDGLSMRAVTRSMSGQHLFARVMVLPVFNALFPGRDEFRRRVVQQFDDAAAYRALPVWEQAAVEKPYDRYGRLRKASHPVARIVRTISMEELVVSPWDVFSPFGSRVQAQTLDVVVALEQHKRAHGQYPASLSALVPAYLAAEPVDHSTGKALLYSVGEDGGFVLYGRGLDGDDDGGVVDGARRYRREKLPEAGDWVVYPKHVDAAD